MSNLITASVRQNAYSEFIGSCSSNSSQVVVIANTDDSGEVWGGGIAE